MAKGWKLEPGRHALAAKGVPTGRKYPMRIKNVLAQDRGIRIEMPKQKGQTDSFFYGDNTIASYERADGTEFFVITSGDVGITIDGNEYRNPSEINEAIIKYKLTDKKMNELEAKGRLEWENNNWFEVEYKKKGNDFWESVDDVAYSYDDAIKLLNKSIVEVV